MALYWICANRGPLRSSTSELDFGHIRVVGKYARAEREIVIENDSEEDIEIKTHISCSCLQSNVPSKLPAKSSTKVKFEVVLQPHEFQRRRIDVYIVPSKKTIAPLVLTAYASVAFSIHVPEKLIDLGLIANVGRSTAIFTAIVASDVELGEPIQKIESNRPEIISTKIIGSFCQKLFDEKKNSFWIYSSTMEVALSPLPTTPFGHGEAVVSLLSSNNLKTEILLRWSLSERTAIEPKVFYLFSSSPNERHKINFVYNRHIGGKEKFIIPQGENLKLIETHIFGEQVFMEFEYQSVNLPPKGEILAKVFIKTEDNRTHSLPIIFL
jgi:hypothetical protein